MSFDTPAGTRGRAPRGANGAVAKWVGQRMNARVRRKGKVMGMDALLLVTTGRRTGQRRETTLAWFPDGMAAWLVVASFGGAARNPDWYYNIAAHPDQVWIEMPDRNLRVIPEQLSGTQRAECWKRIVAAAPRYGKYQAKTDRVFPVIRLVPALRRPA